MTNVTAFKKKIEVVSWELNGDITLEDGSVVNVKTTYKDLGGKKDVRVFKGEFADLLWSYVVQSEYAKAFNCSVAEKLAQQEHDELLAKY